MMAAQEAPLPLRGGCWVQRGQGTGLQVALVKACYRDDNGDILLDLYIFSREGKQLGRVSPREGGPRSFEPCCDLGDWVRIDEPRFPLEMGWVPTKDGNARTPGYTGTTVIPFGSFNVRKRSVPGTRVARRANYDPTSEAAGKRAAAEALRDAVRAIADPATQKILRERAQALEDEADKIDPRHQMSAPSST